MSPYRLSSQRRRSFSVSASTVHDHHCIDLCHPSKRVHSRKDLNRQWDLDSWRRGKRPRTQQFTPFSAAPNDSELTQEGEEITPEPILPPRFPSTSTAFDLRLPSSHPSHLQPSHKSSPHSISTDQDLSALHSYAFWELHQSIKEASEGFVQRMRDWESSRPELSRHDHRFSAHFTSHPRSRGRESSPRILSPLEATSEDANFDSDDDDVLILSDEISPVERIPSLYSASPAKKRARSLGDMDLDSPQMTPTIPPALSHTVASSSTSSLLSLLSPLVVPPLSTREEKAIAALTLALANGAAGLNDYSAVREALGVSAAVADGSSEVGEMWR
ncbi:hypothetical protein B0F90DRAFT_1813180 [Multifurca ochricompacta]|uniref:Uncharacterized protein n=1 Tax=Multifurca ochricompacta TaxID=376703 RepID=A0AAD4QRP5_9AGAM|nr:hypothetical protein B0F90DRAFT_1813180 [Multifurca ochricompacta]